MVPKRSELSDVNAPSASDTSRWSVFATLVTRPKALLPLAAVSSASLAGVIFLWQFSLARLSGCS